MSDVSKKVRLVTLAYATLAVFSTFFFASLVVVYAFPEKGMLADRLKSIAPYPVAIIGYRDGLTYRTLSENVASIKRFYEAQDFSKVGLRVDFSTDEGKKRFKVREKEVFNKMIEDKAVAALARERGIRVSREEASSGVSRKLEEYGNSENVRQDLERLYGWTLADFENKVVMPGLYQEKLYERFTKEVDTSSSAKEKVRLAQEALRSGKAFADVARQYSEGRTAEDGGMLGWFALEDLAPELRQPVVTQKTDVAGDVIESTLGFHIILIEEVKKEEGKQLYRLRQIFARKVTFADWLTKEMRQLSVWVLSPEYRWNADEARAEFRSQEMRDFEKDLFEKAEGDAAFFF